MGGWSHGPGAGGQSECECDDESRAACAAEAFRSSAWKDCRLRGWHGEDAEPSQSHHRAGESSTNSHGRDLPCGGLGCPCLSGRGACVRAAKEEGFKAGRAGLVGAADTEAVVWEAGRVGALEPWSPGALEPWSPGALEPALEGRRSAPGLPPRQRTYVCASTAANVPGRASGQPVPGALWPDWFAQRPWGLSVWLVGLACAWTAADAAVIGWWSTFGEGGEADSKGVRACR